MAAKGEGEKTVLCCFNEHRRSVTLSGTCKELETVVKERFADKIPKEADIFLQINHQGWSGEFIDLTEDDKIVDKSVLSVVVEQQEMVIPFKFF